MNRKFISLFFGMILLSFAWPVQSHELVDINGRPVSTHQHVWRQQEYGTDYRQGHSVDGSQGSITVWSPNTYQGYKAGSSVRFARPVPYTKRSKVEDHRPDLNQSSRQSYPRNK
jgi:hypothetical protein